jgi:Leucine-rich repeat (LRR) protein
VLARLPKLEGAGLDNNQMRVVPENIGQLKSCKRLGLSSNGLNALPDSISNLSALETLDVYNNQLRNLPAGLVPAFRQRRHPLSFGEIGRGPVQPTPWSSLIDDRKDGRVAGNTQHQSSDDSHSKTGRPQEHPRGVLQVLQEGIHKLWVESRCDAVV